MSSQRPYMSPPKLEFDADSLPFPVTETGKYELISWGNAFVFHASDYVDRVRPGLMISRVEYITRVDLVVRDDGSIGPKLDQYGRADYHTISLSRRDTISADSYGTPAARKQVEEVLIPWIVKTITLSPDFVRAGHLARINDALRHAQADEAKAEAELTAAREAIAALLAEEVQYVAD